MRGYSTDICLRTLEELFSAIPLEDGKEHPAETFLASHLDDLKVIEEIILNETPVAAPTLICLGRLPGVPKAFLRRILSHTLHSESIELRDVSIAVLELRPEIGLDLLEGYEETVQWLEEYRRRILKEKGAEAP